MFLPALFTIPPAVIYLAIHHFQLLLSVSIFAASVHVLQQNAFIAEMYRARASRPEGTLIHYALDGYLFLAAFGSEPEKGPLAARLTFEPAEYGDPGTTGPKGPALDTATRGGHPTPRERCHRRSAS